MQSLQKVHTVKGLRNFRVGGPVPVIATFSFKGKMKTCVQVLARGQRILLSNASYKESQVGRVNCCLG